MERRTKNKPRVVVDKKMIYENFKLDSKNWKVLSALKQNSKIPNALLFHGDEGIGKEAYAIEFASLLNCENSSELSYACKNCLSCKKIMNNNHEYLHYIFPLPRGKISSKKDDISKAFNDKTLSSYNHQISLKLENPYHKINIDGANTILINSIRSIKKKIFRTTSNNAWQTILIFNAEKLCFPNQEAANSLLKVLEEPPERTTFILVTSKIDLLLETIKSRCIDFFFSKTTNSTLEQKDSINIYNLVNGNMSILNELKDDDINKIETFLNLYNNCIKESDKTVVIKLIASLEKLAKSNNLLFKTYINVLKNYYRDLAIIKINPDSDQLTFFFLKDDYSIINEKENSLSWDNCIDNICNFERDIELNSNLTLALFNLFNNIGLK